MPIMAFVCPDGHIVKKFLRKVPKGELSFRCPGCGKPLSHQLCAPNSQSLVIVDNGVQAKAVEVNLDMVEKIREQSTKDFSEKD
jgi:transcription initiation factor IIE alpha subunit